MNKVTPMFSPAFQQHYGGLRASAGGAEPSAAAAEVWLLTIMVEGTLADLPPTKPEAITQIVNDIKNAL